MTSETYQQMLRRHIAEDMAFIKGLDHLSINKAAAYMGIQPNTLRKRISRYGIKWPKKGYEGSAVSAEQRELRLKLREVKAPRDMVEQILGISYESFTMWCLKQGGTK